MAQRIATVSEPPDGCAECPAPRAVLLGDTYEGRPAWICGRYGLVRVLLPDGS